MLRRAMLAIISRQYLLLQTIFYVTHNTRKISLGKMKDRHVLFILEKFRDDRIGKMWHRDRFFRYRREQNRRRKRRTYRKCARYFASNTLAWSAIRNLHTYAGASISRRNFDQYANWWNYKSYISWRCHRRAAAEMLTASCLNNKTLLRDVTEIITN